MNGFQQAPCPRCGTTANVHSIQELAALARMQLSRLDPGYSAPGQPGLPGYQQEPVPGQPGGVPGWAQEPQAGPPRDPRSGQPRGYPGPGYSRSSSQSRDTSLGEDLAGIAITEGAKFIGRRIGRRMQRAYTDQVAPALLARDGDRLRTQIAIADKHPDICACLDDNVVFLAGGRAVLPMPDLNTLTVDQADAMVATLRQS